MPSLKEVRNRIVSVNSTMQITSAMKMVSAAKLRRAQDAINRMRPYADKLRELLGNASSSAGDIDNNPYSRVTEDPKRVLIIAITSNRGLCGAFNAQVIRQTNLLIKTRFAGKDVSLLTIGKKGSDFFRKSPHRILGTDLPRKLNELFDNLTFDNVAPVAEVVMKAFAEKQFDEVVMVYNHFKNAAIQVILTEQLLPVVPEETTEKVATTTTDYIYEPGKDYIVRELIPQSIRIQFYKALLDSQASEHGARMTAMHKATDNGKELLKELKITYNKARQASITKEILEIVGGAEALKSA